MVVESFLDGHGVESEAKQVLDKIIVALPGFSPPPPGRWWKNETIIGLFFVLRNSGGLPPPPALPWPPGVARGAQGCR